VSIIVLQLGFAAYVYRLGPGNDRYENVIHGTQYFLEGLGTTSVFAGMFATSEADKAGLQQLGFFCSLFGMFVPIVEKGYDAIIVQISTICRKNRGEEISLLGLFFAMLAFLLTIPGLIAGLMGLNLGSAADLGTTVMDEASGAFEMGLDDMATEAATDALADVASNYLWAQNPMPQHHQAARSIQRVHRMKASSQQDVPNSWHRTIDLAMQARELEADGDGRRPGVEWLESQIANRSEHHVPDPDYVVRISRVRREHHEYAV